MVSDDDCCKYDENFPATHSVITPPPPQILQSGISEHEHIAVCQQYFELVVRYDKFFLSETSWIPHVLVSGEGVEVIVVSGEGMEVILVSGEGVEVILVSGEGMEVILVSGEGVEVILVSGESVEVIVVSWKGV